MRQSLEETFSRPDTVFRFASPSQILYGRGAATRFAEPFGQLGRVHVSERVVYEREGDEC